MKKLVNFVILLLFLHLCQAQKSRIPEKFSYPQAVLLELGGTALFYSLNYEFVFINAPKYKTAIDLGANFIAWDILFPIALTEIITFNSNHLEFGIAYTFASYISPRYSARIGYRYQKPEARFVFRLGFTPWLIISDEYLEPDKNHQFMPWGGLAFGYIF